MVIVISSAAAIVGLGCYALGEISRQRSYGKPKQFKLRWFDHLYAWLAR
jgi:hypothetical protein